MKRWNSDYSGHASNKFTIQWILASKSDKGIKIFIGKNNDYTNIFYENLQGPLFK